MIGNFIVLACILDLDRHGTAADVDSGAVAIEVLWHTSHLHRKFLSEKMFHTVWNTRTTHVRLKREENGVTICLNRDIARIGCRVARSRYRAGH